MRNDKITTIAQLSYNTKTHWVGPTCKTHMHESHPMCLGCEIVVQYELCMNHFPILHGE